MLSRLDKTLLLAAVLLCWAPSAFGQATAESVPPPMAPVILTKANGREVGYGGGATTDAQRGDALLAAQAAASDELVCVYRGTYTISASLGKTGLSYWFAPGVIVETTTADLEVFDDGGAAMTFTVGGKGVFRTTGGDARAVVLTNAASVVRMQCAEIRSNGAMKAGVYLANGATLDLTCDLASSDDYDGIWNDGGNLRAEIKTLIGGGDGLETTGASGSTLVRALTITGNGNAGGGSGGFGLQITMTPTNGLQVIEAQEIKSLLASPIAMRIDGDGVVVRAARYVGQIVAARGTNTHIEGGVQSGLAASQAAVKMGQDSFSTVLNLYGVTLAAGSSAANGIVSNDLAGASTGKTVNIFGVCSINKPVKTNDTVPITYDYGRGFLADTSTGIMTTGAGLTLTAATTMAAEAYNATNWDADNGPATKNDVRDKIETIVVDSGSFSTAASAATLTPVGSSFVRNFHEHSAQAEALTIAAPSGTPLNGYGLIVRIKDNGTTRALTWNAIYANAGAAMPTNTTAGKWHTVGFIYNSTATKWQCVAAAVEP